mgnify:CR=1 FL=1
MKAYAVKLVIWDNYPDTATRRTSVVAQSVSEDELRGIIVSVIDTLKSIGYRSIASASGRITMFGDRTGAKRVIVKHEIEQQQ